MIFLLFWRFTEFGGPIHQRPVQDVAYNVAQFIHRGGSFINYYMPNYGHLKELHRAIKMCVRAIVADPIVTSLGCLQCASFLSNYETKSTSIVLFNNMHYNLPPWSISILHDYRNVVFNTVKVYIKRG
ncbi:LOW QUALITY PROTEIN: hypothetical protein CFOL_v3_21823 [Cephalotus follicularis]|uniref:Beta-galactosidase beta-sandwich domain-containing protein n=1 Tax=Cephalotus follicularis TaxID=3775 RepID=A0A1Q3CDQ9_CEPFO|nr:LOW QUALITY PROTEIN: hypothetical protein CFOL_v3_21823 [Cephalotus follicularis]